MIELKLLFLLLTELTSFFSARGFNQTTVFIPLTITVYVVGGVLRVWGGMCAVWCGVCVTCHNFIIIRNSGAGNIHLDANITGKR